MKKLMFVMTLGLLSLSFISCVKTSSSESCVDSLIVSDTDSVCVDSMCVDTLAVDSAVCLD